MTENEIGADLDRTVASLQGGMESTSMEAALAEIEGWEYRLSGDPELEPVVENLGRLRLLLSAAGDFDPVAVGRLLVALAEQTQRVANSEEVPIEVADKLSQLNVLLAREGESLSGEPEDPPGLAF